MGSLGVVWERRQAGERARCNERPKVCASLPLNLIIGKVKPIQNGVIICGLAVFQNPILAHKEIYVWNFFCLGQRRATSFIAFAVFFLLVSE